MKFTILMPTTRRKYLAKAIQSVIDQTYQDWELLIAPWGDDVRGFQYPSDGRIRVLDRTEENLPSALNAMMDQATGAIFNIAADDDVMTPFALNSASHVQNDGWLVGRISTADSVLGGTCTYDQMLSDNLIPCPAVYWTEPLRFDPGHPYCFDYDYWLRMWESTGAPKFINAILSVYRNHPDQVSHLHADAVRADADSVKREHGF